MAKRAANDDHGLQTHSIMDVRFLCGIDEQMSVLRDIGEKDDQFF